jgi:hypothetical protein
MSTGIYVVPETSTPDTPASGLRVLYAKSDGWYEKDSAGVETKLGGASAKLTTLTDGATINWATTFLEVAKVTLGGNRTMAAPTAIANGGIYRLIVIQDGTGTRTLTWNAVFKWPAGVAPVLTTTANAIDIFDFVSQDGTNLLCTNGAFDVK